MRKFKKLISVLSIFLFVLMIIPTDLFAVGTYSASVGNSTILVGNTTPLTISTKNAAGKFTVSSSNTSVATVTKATTWVDGTMDDAIMVKGVKAGTATITITPTDVSDDEYNLIKTPKHITVTVRGKAVTPSAKPTVKSSDATLKSLVIEGINIKFDPSVNNYTIYVDKSVDSLKINATPNSPKAKVTITGNSNFVIGNNIVIITVTAEDGTVNKYELTVVKSKFGKGPLVSLEVVGFELDKEFDPSVLVYSVNAVGINKVYIKYALADEESTVEIIGADNLVIGKNVVIVKVTEKDGTVTEYRINVNVSENTATIVEKNDTIWIVVIVILSALLIVETIFIIVKKKKDKK